MKNKHGKHAELAKQTGKDDDKCADNEQGPDTKQVQIFNRQLRFNAT